MSVLALRRSGDTTQVEDQLPLNWEQTRAVPLDLEINTCTGALKVVGGDEVMWNASLTMVAKELEDAP